MSGTETLLSIPRCSLVLKSDHIVIKPMNAPEIMICNPPQIQKLNALIKKNKIFIMDIQPEDLEQKNFQYCVSHWKNAQWVRWHYWKPYLVDLCPGKNRGLEGVASGETAAFFALCGLRYFFGEKIDTAVLKQLS
jgi:hypothetical protein